MMRQLFHQTTRRQVRHACRQCKHRKVRCDGGPGCCDTCQRLGFSCSFTQIGETGARTFPYEQPTPETPFPRKLRGSRACARCRVLKIRCSGTLPQCATCLRRGQTCFYPESRRRPERRVESSGSSPRREPEQSLASHANVSASESSPVDAGRSLGFESPTQDAVHYIETHLPDEPASDNGEEMIKTFFEDSYPMPCHAFLHPASTWEDFHKGTLDRTLLLSICALTTLRRGGDQSRRYLGARWVRIAEEEIWKRLGRPSVPRLQALLLIISYRIETGAYQKAFMLAGLAARAISAMHLTYERTDLSATCAEVRRRIVWCFKLIESYFYVGLAEFELCPFECIYVDPPSSEMDFRATISRNTVLSSVLSRVEEESGSLGVCLRLTMIRRDIKKWARELAVCDQPFPQLVAVISGLEEELWKVRSKMSQSVALVGATLPDLVNSPWLPRYVMMWTSWHQCFCDLFRLLLPGFPDAAPQTVLDAIDPTHIRRAENICREHALSVLTLLADVNQQCTTPRYLEYDAAVCGYHVSRLLLFLSTAETPSSTLSLEFAVSRVELCVAAIKRFFRTSIRVQPMLEEFDRMMQTGSLQGDSPSTWGSPKSVVDDALPLSAPGLSPAARVRGRLAIHSLLQQADFSDI